MPKTTLQFARNPTPAGWNHPHGQQYPQINHNKTTPTWAPVTLNDIQWKPFKIDLSKIIAMIIINNENH